MKTFFSFLVLCLFAICFSGCSGNSAKVITADLVSNALSGVTITALDCTATDVVTADIKQAVNVWFSINATQQKGIVQDICITSIASIVPTLIGTTIPTTWKCKQTKLDNAAAALANLACAKIMI
jgi:hypothetical protein